MGRAALVSPPGGGGVGSVVNVVTTVPAPPTPADTTWNLVLGSGGYTWDAALSANVDGNPIAGAGLSMDGVDLQIPASYIASMDDSPSGFSVVSDGSQSGGQPMQNVGCTPASSGGYAKFKIDSMDPSAQFDLQMRSAIVNNPANSNFVGTGILLWVQSAANYKSRGLWWGFGGNGLETSNIPWVAPTMLMGVAPSNFGFVWRGTFVWHGTSEMWSRLRRDSSGILHAEYKLAGADPWIEDPVMGEAGWPDVFGGGSEVKLGFGMSFGGWETERVIEASFNYKAAV